jgi:hypothetical protein
MDESAKKFVCPDGQQKPGGGLLDRVDRALINAWRFIWRCTIDGFAAYGAAECGLFLDPAFEPTDDREAEILETPNYPYNYGAVAEEYLRSDFADIDELIRALQTAGE